MNDLEQRVLIVGNTDFLSNGEFATGRREVRNFNGILKHAAFYWLSHEELPVNTEGDAPIDRKLYVSEAAMEICVYGRDTCYTGSCRDYYMGTSSRALIFKSLFYEYDI